MAEFILSILCMLLFLVIVICRKLRELWHKIRGQYYRRKKHSPVYFSHKNQDFPKDRMNDIMEERYRDYGIEPEYDEEGKIGYIPDIEDEIAFYENCDDPELKQIRGVALMEMMGDPDGDDSWTEVF